MPAKTRHALALSTMLATLSCANAIAATYSYNALIKSFDMPVELGGLEYRATSGAPTINNDLEAVGTAALLPPALSGVGFRLLRYDGAQFSIPVESGSSVPGMPNATIDLTPTNPIVSQNGDVLFLSSLSGSGATFPANTGLFRLRDGQLETLVRGGDVINGVEVNYLAITSTSQGVFGSISANGRVAFSDRTHVFREEGSGFEIVVRTGDKVPSSSGATIGRIGEVDIADDGSVYFVSAYLGPTGLNEGPAVFREQERQISVLLEPSQVVEGAQLDSLFSEITGVNAAGDFVVVGDANRGDVIKSVDGVHSVVILNGDMAPGIDDPLGFFSNAEINSSGDVAFFATNRDNPACNASVECGIFAETSGELGLVAKRGDTIEIAPGDFRTISGLEISPRGGFLNDLGQVAFLAMFNGPDNPGLGDTQAWIIATPNSVNTPVPAPPSIALLMSGVLGLCLVRRRRRLFANADRCNC